MAVAPAPLRSQFTRMRPRRFALGTVETKRLGSAASIARAMLWAKSRTVAQSATGSQRHHDMQPLAAGGAAEAGQPHALQPLAQVERRLDHVGEGNALPRVKVEDDTVWAARTTGSCRTASPTISKRSGACSTSRSPAAASRWCCSPTRPRKHRSSTTSRRAPQPVTVEAESAARTVAPDRSRRQLHRADADPTDEALRAWRLERSRADGVPAYVVLSNATVAEIAQAQPRNPRELSRISGIGPTKLERYGDRHLRSQSSSNLKSCGR